MESIILEEYSNEELKAMVEDPNISASGFRDIIIRGLAERSAFPHARIKKYPLDAMLLNINYDPTEAGQAWSAYEVQAKGMLLYQWSKAEAGKTPAPS